MSGAGNGEQIVADDEFDRLWDDAVKEAALNPKNKSRAAEPSEQLAPHNINPHLIVSGATRRRQSLPASRLSSHQSQLVASAGGANSRRRGSALAVQHNKPSGRIKEQSSRPPRGGSAVSFGLNASMIPLPGLPAQQSEAQSSSDEHSSGYRSGVSNPQQPQSSLVEFKPGFSRAKSEGRRLRGRRARSSSNPSTSSTAAMSDGDTSDLASECDSTFNKRNSSSMEEQQREVAEFALKLQPPTETELSLPRTFHATAFKETRSQSSGLVLSLNDKGEAGTVIIKDIHRTSIFSATNLSEGNEVLAINNHRVKYPQQAAKIIKSIKGQVDILFSDGERFPGTKYIRVKKTPSVKTNSHGGRVYSLGIQLNTVKEVVQVVDVESDGPFATSSLRPGDIILTINGTVAVNAYGATKMLANCDKLICALVFSMHDFRLGLTRYLADEKWDLAWNDAGDEVTLSKTCAGGNSYGSSSSDDGRMKFVLKFYAEEYSWQCIQSENAEDEVYRSVIQPLVNDMNSNFDAVVTNLGATVKEAYLEQQAEMGPQC